MNHLAPSQADHDAEMAYRAALESCNTPEQVASVQAMQKIVLEYVERLLHPRPVKVLRLVNGKPAPDAA